MKRIQKRAQTRVNALANINGGLHALRESLAARLPDDFACWFTDSVFEVVAGYQCTATGHMDEVRAPNVGALLVKWQAIDWQAERRKPVCHLLARGSAS